MNVVVLGSTNYVGRHVVEQLSSTGHSVTAVIDDNNQMPLFKNIETVKNIEIARFREIDVICQCTSYELLHDKKMAELNEEIVKTKNLIKTAAFHQYVHLSSTLVYELDPPKDVDESYDPIIKNELQDKALYWEKVISDLCIENNIASIILRPANPIGPGDPSSFFTRLLACHDQNVFPIVGNGTAKISLIDVRDIGKAMDWLIRQNFTDPNIFLLKGFDANWLDIKKQIDLCTGKRSRQVDLKEEEIDQYGLTPISAKMMGIDRVWNDHKIRSLGFKPTFALKEAINDYFKQRIKETVK